MVSGAAAANRENDEAAVAATMKRHAAFLGGGPSTSWRAQKKYRATTAKVLQMMDNQLRVSSVFNGLAFFKPPCDENGRLLCWSKWPHLALSCDQGSDMLCAVSALCYYDEVKICLTPYLDPSHQANRDCWLAIVDLDLKPVMLLLMICMNLCHGPNDSQLRLAQIVETMESHYHNHTPATSPFFKSMQRQILDEWQHLESVEGEAFELTVWRSMAEASFFRRVGDKVCMARFLAIIGGGRGLVAKWHTFLFEVSVTAVELGFVNAKMAPKIKLRSSGASGPSERETTNRRHITDADRTVRSCGSNAVGISFAILSDTNNLRILATVVKFSEPTMSWMGMASRELREVGSSRDCVLRQVRHQCMDNINHTLAVFYQEDFLRKALFITTSSEALLHLKNDDLVCEDEAAALAGDFGLSMCK